MDSPRISPRGSTTATPLVVSIDDHNWSYWAFVWLGLGSLLSLNFFITADPYFRYKLHDSTMPNSSASFLELSYENAVVLSASAPNLIAALLVTFIFVPYIHKTRIYVSLIGTTICLLICFAFIFVDVSHWREIFFGITMIIVMVQSALGAILLNCFFSLASTLPSRYIQGFVAGQALGGVFVVCCSIASILFSSNVLISASIYFLLAILILISNILTFFALEKSHLLQIYSSAVQEINNEHEPLLGGSSSYEDSINNTTVHVTSLATRQRLRVAFKHTKWNALGIFLSFVCTLSLFPGYMSKIQPAWPSIAHPDTLWTDRLYPQVMTFLLFNIGDTLGRVISLRIQIPSLLRPRLLFILCTSRFIFIPLMGLCHFPNTNYFPYVFKHDLIYALLVLAFAISHGYFNSINMMYAPRRVHAQLSSTVGALMSMALTSGIFVGSLLSYGVVAMFGVDKPPNVEHIQ